MPFFFDNFTFVGSKNSFVKSIGNKLYLSYFFFVLTLKNDWCKGEKKKRVSHLLEVSRVLK